MANGTQAQPQSQDPWQVVSESPAPSNASMAASAGQNPWQVVSTTPAPAQSQIAQPKTDTGVWAGIKRNTVGMVSGLYHALSDPATDEEKQQLLAKVRAENARAGNNVVPDTLATNPSRATLAYHRLIDAPADVLHQKGSDEQSAAKDLLDQGQAWKGSNLYLSGATDRLLSAVPMAGPWLNSVAERWEKGDKSGAATDVASAIAFSNAKPVAKLVGEKVAPTVSDALRSSAEKNYANVINPTKQTTKYQTNKIMPQLLEERPVALTRKGLAEKAGARAEEAGQEIEQQVSNLQGSTNTQPIIDGLQNLKKAKQVKGVSLRPEVDKAIDAVSDQFKQMGPDISLQEAVRARRILDEAVAEAKGYQGAELSDASLAKIRKEAANSIRTELGKASPELAAVNAKFHFWNTLNDVLEQTIERKTGQAPLLREMIGNAAAAGAGLVKEGAKGGGKYGAAMYTLGKVFRSTGWRTVSAATKASLADALASGNFDEVGSLLGKAAQAGQVAQGGRGATVTIQDSQGGIHSIPEESLDKAKERDPDLKVLN